MKFIKQDLLTLLISLFILSSCNKTDSVGLEVDPDYAINGSLIDTSTIQAVTVREDSIITNTLSQYPMGYMNDPVFGTTVANLALSLNLPNDNLVFGTSPVLDSAVLVLKYDDFYGDSLNTSYRVNVHQLTERLNSDSYYNTHNFPYNNSVIGSTLVGRVRLKDSVRVQDIIEGRADGEKRVAPQLRIPINAAFVNANIINADSASLSNTTAFNEFIKGLYVTINQEQTNGPGGVMFFDLTTDGASSLEVYYKTTTQSVTDTVMQNFKITSSSAPVASTFTHNYTGTAVADQLNNPAQTYSTTFVQGLAGLKTKVNFPYLSNLKSLGEVTINKAELVIDVEGGAAPFAPASRLFLYRTDIAGQKQVFPDISDSDYRGLSEQLFGGYYDTNSKRYIFSVTSYIQDIINGRLKQYDAFISVVDPLTDKYTALNPSGTAAGRSILGGFTNPDPQVKMKLNIYYTATK